MFVILLGILFSYHCPITAITCKATSACIVSWTGEFGDASADGQLASQFEPHKCPEREVLGGRAMITIDESGEHVDYCVVQVFRVDVILDASQLYGSRSSPRFSTLWLQRGHSSFNRATSPSCSALCLTMKKGLENINGGARIPGGRMEATLLHFGCGFSSSAAAVDVDARTFSSPNQREFDCASLPSTRPPPPFASATPLTGLRLVTDDKSDLNISNAEFFVEAVAENEERLLRVLSTLANPRTTRAGGASSPSTTLVVLLVVLCSCLGALLVFVSAAWACRERAARRAGAQAYWQPVGDERVNLTIDVEPLAMSDPIENPSNSSSTMRANENPKLSLIASSAD